MTVLRELYYGKGAHVNPLACLEDVSADLACRKIEGYPHSIYQIVEHMNYWMDYEIRRINGQQQQYPQHAIESWPSANATNGKEWDDTRARFTSLLGRLESLSHCDHLILKRQVEPDKASATVYTVEDVLWQMMAHNSYHIGQVAMVRRCLGVWPPRGGGDSW